MSAVPPSVLDSERVRSYVLEAAGEPGVRLVEVLEKRKSATDSELAAVLGSKPSHIRKILYSLYEARVAEYTKEKDKETGWLTFFWHVTPENAEYALEQRRLKAIEGLRLQLADETGHDWYVCPSEGARFDFTRATEVGFHCDQCGALLDHEDNARRIAAIQARLGELEHETAS